jgi:hypothetical protein
LRRYLPGDGKVRGSNQMNNKKIYMKRFNLKKLNEAEDYEQCRVKISNGLPALENFDDVNINRAWETIRQNIKYQLKRA